MEATKLSIQKDEASFRKHEEIKEREKKENEGYFQKFKRKVHEPNVTTWTMLMINALQVTPWVLYTCCVLFYCLKCCRGSEYSKCFEKGGGPMAITAYNIISLIVSFILFVVAIVLK